MRYFLDNCVSIRLARALDCLTPRDTEIVHLRDRFGADTDDEVWLPELGRERNWVVISGDCRIIRTPPLRAEWEAAHLCSFFLADGYTSLDRWQQFHRAIKWWPEIEAKARKGSRTPTSYRIKMRGGFERLDGKKRKRKRRRAKRRK